MNKKLIDKLNKATDKAAVISMQRGSPMPITKKLTLIGNLIIEKNSNGFYDVIKSDRSKLYSNISVFDVAIIVAQRYNSNELSIIKEVLKLEERFVKYHTDMIHYLHCMKAAKKKDNQRLAILEDKFQSAEINAKAIRDQLVVFKRMK